ncbi:MAG: AAA family ATPase [Candidatus Staskawiczbacteria bacterium]
MKKIILTGGTSGGKTTILERLKKRFNRNAVFVRETATLLLEGGYPKPGDLLPWSQDWHLLFEDAVFYLQRSLEDASSLVARHQNCDLIICDRGLLDVAGHLPGGRAQFCCRYDTTEEESLSRYDVVIHLVSFAMFDPTGYSAVAETRWGNSHLSSLEYAHCTERATLDAWSNHKRRYIVGGQGNIDRKTAEVIEIIERAIA